MANTVPNPPVSVISTGIHWSGSAWCLPVYGHWPHCPVLFMTRVRPKKKKINHGFCFTLRSGTRQRWRIYSFLFIILAVLANVMKQKNKHRAYKTRKGEIELFLLTDNTKVYIENLKNSTYTQKRIPIPFSEFSKIVRYNIKYKTQSSFYMIAMKIWNSKFLKHLNFKHNFLFLFIFISWRLITLQYCSGFCHTLIWISHGFTCIPHPDPPSYLPLHPIPLGLSSAPGPSTCLMHPTWAGDLFHPR